MTDKVANFLSHEIDYGIIPAPQRIEETNNGWVLFSPFELRLNVENNTVKYKYGLDEYYESPVVSFHNDNVKSYKEPTIVINTLWALDVPDDHCILQIPCNENSQYNVLSTVVDQYNGLFHLKATLLLEDEGLVRINRGEKLVKIFIIDGSNYNENLEVVNNE